MNVERLEKLEEVLLNFKTERENLVEPITKFDMREWHCGTAACALGTAALHPWFRRRGLKLVTMSEYFSVPTYKGHEYYDAAEAFFDLSAAGVQYLFASYRWDEAGGLCENGVRDTPRTVAKRVRKLLDGKVVL